MQLQRPIGIRASSMGASGDKYASRPSPTFATYLERHQISSKYSNLDLAYSSNIREPVLKRARHARIPATLAREKTRRE